MKWLAKYHASVNDLTLFKSVPVEKRARILWEYLYVCSPMSSYSDVAKIVYNSRNLQDEAKVSAIIHGYNFFGQNSGVFKNYKYKDYLVNAINVFVRTFSDGSASVDYKNIIFEEWVEEDYVNSIYFLENSKVAPDAELYSKKIVTDVFGNSNTKENSDAINKELKDELESYYNEASNWLLYNSHEYYETKKEHPNNFTKRNIKVGDTVEFGHFISNKKIPISWIVVDIKDDKALLLCDRSIIKTSDYSIDNKLNELYDSSFDNNEKLMIVPINNKYIYKYMQVFKLKSLPKIFGGEENYGLKIIESKEVLENEKVFILNFDELKKYAGKNGGYIPAEVVGLGPEVGFGCFYWTRQKYKYEVKDYLENREKLAWHSPVFENEKEIGKYTELDNGGKKITQFGVVINGEQLMENVPDDINDPEKRINDKYKKDIVKNLRLNNDGYLRPAIWVKREAIDNLYPTIAV